MCLPRTENIKLLLWCLELTVPFGLFLPLFPGWVLQLQPERIEYSPNITKSKESQKKYNKDWHISCPNACCSWLKGLLTLFYPSNLFNNELDHQSPRWHYISNKQFKTINMKAYHRKGEGRFSLAVNAIRAKFEQVLDQKKFDQESISLELGLAFKYI